MKNIKLESEDSLRPEYKRSDFGEIRVAAIQVEFAERVGLFLACIGEDEGVKFANHSPGNLKAGRRLGDWTYELDTANQVTLRYWLDSLRNIELNVTNPPCVTSPEENTKLQDALMEGVRELKAKVGNQP